MILHSLVYLQNATKKFFFQKCFLVTKDFLLNCETFYLSPLIIAVRQDHRQREKYKGTKEFLAKRKHFFFFISSVEGKTRGLVFTLTECGLQKQKMPETP